MLAYRHQFHAGNFADVFKHALLAQLVLAMARKDKPFLYLDTHAGIGQYDLLHEWAQKNAEHKDGVVRVWARSDVPEEMQPYFDALRTENPGGTLRFYPGSPAIVRRLIRPIDRMVLTELNPKDCEALAALYVRDRHVTVELADGYGGLNAHLPPKERRGLIFIDEVDKLKAVSGRARSLRGIFEEMMIDELYAIPDNPALRKVSIDLLFEPPRFKSEARP